MPQSIRRLVLRSMSRCPVLPRWPLYLGLIVPLVLGAPWPSLAHPLRSAPVPAATDLATAERYMHSAQQHYTRIYQLHQAGVVSQAALEEARLQYTAAVAQRDLWRAQSSTSPRRPIAQPLHGPTTDATRRAALEAQIRAAKTRYERNQRLYQEGVIPAAEVTRAESAYRDALFQRDLASGPPGRQAEWAKLMAELTLAEANVERYQSLYQAGAVTRLAFEQAQLAYQQRVLARDQFLRRYGPSVRPASRSN
jgi:multidrug resistance efflux pump